MADYLMRDDAPLSSEQWEAADELVVKAAKRILVGRQFIPIAGPFGAGMQIIPMDVYEGAVVGAIDLLGEAENEPIRASDRRQIQLPILYKDFALRWRDIETSKQTGVPLDLSPAAAAAAFCASAEDHLIFNGDGKLNAEGLLNAKGRNTIPMSDWTTEGHAFGDVVKAREKLVSAGFYPPYALVVSPHLYALMYRLHGTRGFLEIEQVGKVCEGGVFQSPALPPNGAVMVSTGPQNMDLVIGQDLITAFLETSKMNHLFRVFETIALRIKRPGAICTVETKSS